MKNKYPLLCRLIGHKFVCAFYGTHSRSDTIATMTINEPRCKRCGIKITTVDKQ